VFEALKTVFAVVLNAPWTFLCGVAAVISVPTRLEFRGGFMPVFIIHVRSLWWYTWMPEDKNASGWTMGNAILLSPRAVKADLTHELVHVEQYCRAPFVQTYLYMIESWRHDYRHNKYEVEAFTRAKN